MSGIRIDRLLVEKGLAKSRPQAVRLIAAGLVEAGGKAVTKPSQKYSVDAQIRLTGEDPCCWVSRAGLKLEHAAAFFEIDFHGKHVLDIGASTGGFTEVALAGGAAHVTAVEVGTGQMDESLRRLESITLMEKTNARDLVPEMFARPPDMVVCDASFISLEKILPAALGIAEKGAVLVALIKPQFEAGKGNLGKGGIVKDAALHRQICADTAAFLDNAGWTVRGLTDSPIDGADGNKEFLICAEKR
ncbi:MAG: TlyA family RNA methyltransferase [Micavibrio sp.]|nr:MAG: TlyA family RNA methyltransferase [Micavibrio sp.]